MLNRPAFGGHIKSQIDLGQPLFCCLVLIGVHTSGPVASLVLEEGIPSRGTLTPDEWVRKLSEYPELGLTVSPVGTTPRSGCKSQEADE